LASDIVSHAMLHNCHETFRQPHSIDYHNLISCLCKDKGFLTAIANTVEGIAPNSRKVREAGNF
jgi:hypothetical protein